MLIGTANKILKRIHNKADVEKSGNKEMCATINQSIVTKLNRTKITFVAFFKPPLETKIANKELIKIVITNKIDLNETNDCNNSIIF